MSINSLLIWAKSFFGFLWHGREQVPAVKDTIADVKEAIKANKQAELDQQLSVEKIETAKSSDELEQAIIEAKKRNQML